MEMTKIDENIQTAQNMMSWIVERCYELEEENKKLNEKVRFLEECLDRKEKLNEKYRKEIDEYKRQYEHSMWEDDELIYEEWLYD